MPATLVDLPSPALYVMGKQDAPKVESGDMGKINGVGAGT